MSKDFPHLDDTRFPDLQTTNVYKYRNELDYSAYEVSTKIKLLNVPWCGDYDNAVYFETREERDKWFDSQNGAVKEMPTMFRLYADGDIKVELPIDECMEYNYVIIDYGKAPYQDKETKYSKMFYFISDMKQDSVNTTRLQLEVDYWTTCVYDMGITYVNLERGHAPMAETDADTYLGNPLENSEFLLTDDVSYGYLQRVTATENVIFNDYTGNLEDMTLGFQTSASMDKSWQIDGNPCIPTAAFESSQAFSSVDPFVIDSLAQWEAFRDTVIEQCPQFFETVKGMFIVPKKLLTYSTSFEFCGFTCHFLASHGDKLQGGIKLEKEMFGYPGEYSDIAKLYTYPYAAIEVTDFKGSTMQIRVEDTAGSVEVRTMMCDMYPFLGIEAYLTGIGSGGRSELRFQNNFTHTMTIGGRYYDFSTKWNIPVFSVQLTPQADWELDGKIAADATIANVNTQLTLDKSNMDLSNQATKDMTANNQQVERSVFNIAKWLQQANGEFGKILAADLFKTDVDYGTTTMTNTSIGSLVSAGVGVVEGFAHGAAGAAIATKQKDADKAMNNAIAGDMVSGAANAINTGVNVVVSSLNYAALVTKNRAALEAYWGDMDSSFGGATGSGYNYYTWKNTTDFDYKRILAGQAAIAGGSYASYGNSTGTSITETVTGTNEIGIKLKQDVYDNTKEAQTETSTRTYDAKRNQTYLSNHPTFGQLTGTPDIISKPFGLSFNAVTQSKNAIRQAAEQFMRYGYTLNMQWKVGSFNVMPRFSYWKCSSVYCDDSGVYEGGQAMVKSILERGITVWRNPDDIGRISIYENR